MLQDLRRLLKLYEFYDQIVSDGAEKSWASEASMPMRLARLQRDRILLEIVTFSSTEPSVTSLQTKFLLSCLGNLVNGRDRAVADALREACSRHVDSLTASTKGHDRSAHTAGLKVRGKRRQAGHAWRSDDFACLNMLSDRAAVFDRDYRYVTTNLANAEFHKMSANAFVGRGHWEVMGDTFFEEVSRPKFDACLAGHSTSFFANKFARNGEIFWLRLSPIRDAVHAVVGIVAVASDVSTLEVPSEMGFHSVQARR